MFPTNIVIYAAPAYYMPLPGDNPVFEIQDAQEGQTFRFDAASATWKNVSGGSGGPVALNDLTDVTITAPTDGQVLKRVGGVWVNAAESGGGGDAATLNGHDGTYYLDRANHTGNIPAANVSEDANNRMVTDAQMSDWDSKAAGVHTHPINQVTGLETALNGKAPAVHTHIVGDVTGLQADLDGKANAVHTHPISDITGLQTALNGKAAAVHTHAISDVTGLQAALDAKATQADISTAVAGKENTTNKAVDLTAPDNTKYPTTQAVATALATKANTSSLASVATSGNYNDLSNKPSVYIGSSLPADISGYPDGQIFIIN